MGAVAGGTTFYAVRKSLDYVNDKTLGKYDLSSNHTTSIKEITQIANQMVAYAKLKGKGFSYDFINEGNAEKCLIKLTESFNNRGIIKKLKSLHPQCDTAVTAGAEGKFLELINAIKEDGYAAYDPCCNYVLASESKPSLILHEIGHAINANKSPLMKKLILSAHVFPVLILPITLLTTLLHTKKDDNNPSKSFFIKDNAGKITFISFFPMILEEAMASFHGLNFAKKGLNNISYGALRSFLAIAVATYIAVATTATVAVKAASYVRDKVAAPKEPVKS